MNRLPEIDLEPAEISSEKLHSSNGSGSLPEIDLSSSSKALPDVVLTSEQNAKVKQICIDKKVIIFLIGGAADKRSYLGSGPTGLVTRIQGGISQASQEAVNQGVVRFVYLGYYEVFGEEAIWKVLLDTGLAVELDGEFFLMQDEIIIIGHSLGGWNGAHFGTLIKSWKKNQAIKKIHADSPTGLNVKLLTTLDPVGEGVIVGMFSDIYFHKPKVTVSNWINIRYDSDDYSRNDLVADLGGRWHVESGPKINIVAKLDHAETLAAMIYPLNQQGETALHEVTTIVNECS